MKTTVYVVVALEVEHSVKQSPGAIVEDARDAVGGALTVGLEGNEDYAHVGVARIASAWSEAGGYR
jgi:hypothetical protein